LVKALDTPSSMLITLSYLDLGLKIADHPIQLRAFLRGRGALIALCDEVG